MNMSVNAKRQNSSEKKSNMNIIKMGAYQG